VTQTQEPRLDPARHPILVPVDFPDCSRAALLAEYVAKYARSPVMTVKDDSYLPGSLNLSWLDTAHVPGGI